MRVLYKAVASVSMLVLSAAAALGIRYLRRLRKKRAEANASDVSKTDAPDDAEQDHSDAGESPADADAQAAESDEDGQDHDDSQGQDHDDSQNDDQDEDSDSDTDDVVEADTPVKSDIIQDQD